MSLILTLISTFVIILMGRSASQINDENKSLKDFLNNTEDIQTNFEQSLIMYTETTQDLMAYVLKLRPESEGEYIQFISEIEEIGQENLLDIDLFSLDPDDSSETVDSGSNVLLYEVKFYGTYEQMRIFIEAIEQLDYYVKIQTIQFRNPTLLSKENADKPNISIKLKLYVR